MWRRIAVLTIGVALGMSTASTADAKGPLRGFRFDGYMVPGQRASSLELLDIQGHQFLEHAPYFAYLRKRVDARANFNWPSPRLDAPLQLGKVHLRPFRYRGARRVVARLSFAVPEVKTGLYDVVVCDADCVHEVRRLGPAGLYVVSGALERRLRNEIDALYSEVSRWENRVVRLKGRLAWKLSSELRERHSITDRVTALERQLAALQGRLADGSKQEEPTPAPVYFFGGTASLLALGGVAFARRRRRNRSRSHP